MRVKPSGFPVEAEGVEIKTGQHVRQTNMYVRLPNKTHKFIDEDEEQKFVAHQWPATWLLK